jgi:hypothetical protein
LVAEPLGVPLVPIVAVNVTGWPVLVEFDGDAESVVVESYRSTLVDVGSVVPPTAGSSLKSGLPTNAPVKVACAVTFGFDGPLKFGGALSVALNVMVIRLAVRQLESLSGAGAVDWELADRGGDERRRPV